MKFMYNILAFVLIFIMFSLFNRNVPVNNFGFFCDDKTIAYPFRELIIPFNKLFIFALLVPNMFMYALRNPNIRNPLLHFNFGFIVQIFFTEYVKYIIGRPRPHFMSVCKPDVDCSDPINKDRFITEYSCTGHYDKFYINNSRKSFFSGHSCSAMFTAFYFILFLRKRFRTRTLLMPLCEFLIFSLGLFPGFTQLINYWHHWSDILCGYLIGIFFAIWSFFINQEISLN